MIEFSRSTNHPGGKVLDVLQFTYMSVSSVRPDRREVKYLQKTSTLIKFARKSKLKACFARFVWGNLEIHEAVRAEIWQSLMSG